MQSALPNSKKKLQALVVSLREALGDRDKELQSQRQALESREAHITASTKTDSLKQGKCSVSVPHATGLRVTVS